MNAGCRKQARYLELAKKPMAKKPMAKKPR